MYPQPKKDAFGWFVTVFVWSAVLLLVGAVVFAFCVARGGDHFSNLKGGDSDAPLSLER